MLAIQERKYDQFHSLLRIGKERGYLLAHEVSSVLASDGHITEAEVDSLFATFESDGIEIYEDSAAAPAARSGLETGERREFETSQELSPDESEIDLKPDLSDKTTDPVRTYLREMGIVPLLTREQEVAIAKRMEQGQLLVLKTVSRSPIVLKELLKTRQDLRDGARSIKEIVQLDDEEMTAEGIEDATRHTLRIIRKIEKLYHLGLQEASQLENIARENKGARLRARRQLAPTRIELSRLVRSIDFKECEKCRLIEMVRRAVEQLGS